MATSPHIHTTASPGVGYAEFASRQRRLVFGEPEEVVSAARVEDVWPALLYIDGRVNEGLYAAGFVCYDAAPAFDDALETHPGADIPLLWFGLYRGHHEEAALTPGTLGSETGPHDWSKGLDEHTFRKNVERIRELIAAGDTYQVNYTFRLSAEFDRDPLAWYRTLCWAQGADYAAYIDTGRFNVLSASPELFFSLDGETITTKPMKGTAKRGRWAEEDRQFAGELAASEKDRAENLMIVDLLRNDMGRICETGSVHVPRLFELERYETVWQLTSTIAGTTTASVPEIFAALFPSGSVTGAPKIRTMRIIREVESTPRGVYCGAVGWWGPGRQAEFNVAIRTATVDRERRLVHYSVGAGITWGSDPAREYQECALKAAVLRHHRPPFELLETILWKDGTFHLLERHLTRLKSSADYFGFEFDIEKIRYMLNEAAAHFAPCARVRLLLSRHGEARIESGLLASPGELRVALAPESVNSNDIFLYHKTTNRTVYDHAKASRPDVDDVILWNDQGEVTESTIANVAIERDGQWVTPPLSSGLLPGTMRQQLLDRDEVVEAVVRTREIRPGCAIQLFNSVRGRVSARVVE